jgi:hypothetical protein
MMVTGPGRGLGMRTPSQQVVPLSLLLLAAERVVSPMQQAMHEPPRLLCYGVGIMKSLMKQSWPNSSAICTFPLLGRAL